MPAIGFRCPNGDTVKFNECLNGNCDHRCMALPALNAAEKSTHHWYGKFSVTTLLKPTRMVYLEHLRDYYVDPLGGIAAMIGTNSHKAFEESSPEGWMAEHRMTDDITSGAFDAYDMKNQVLWDFKFFRSARIARCLGMRSRWTKKVITRGKYKGQERWEQVWEPGGVRDVMDIALQLNYYRYMMENEGLPVKAIRVNMFLRSSVDAEAKKMGLDKPSYIVPINFISLKWVRLYFETKNRILQKALESGKCPPPCSSTERWNSSKGFPNRRCALWCSVNEQCDFYKTHWCGNHNKGMDTE